MNIPDIMEADRERAPVAASVRSDSFAVVRHSALAKASVAQQEAELMAAQRRLDRTESAAPGGAIAQTQVDEDRARAEGARAAVSAAEAQVAAAESALHTARAQVVDAEAAVEAARATIERIQADIDDSELRSPRSGRVQ